MCQWVAPEKFPKLVGLFLSEQVGGDERGTLCFLPVLELSPEFIEKIPERPIKAPDRKVFVSAGFPKQLVFLRL